MRTREIATTLKFAPVVQKTNLAKVKERKPQEQPVYFINGWIIPETAFGGLCVSCQAGVCCYSGNCPCCR